MRKRIPWDDTLPEYYGKIPRTVEEAFGPHSKLTLPEEEEHVLQLPKPSRAEMRLALCLLAALCGCLVVLSISQR